MTSIILITSILTSSILNTSTLTTYILITIIVTTVIVSTIILTTNILQIWGHSAHLGILTRQSETTSMLEAVVLAHQKYQQQVQVVPAASFLSDSLAAKASWCENTAADRRAEHTVLPSPVKVNCCEEQMEKVS